MLKDKFLQTGFLLSALAAPACNTDRSENVDLYERNAKATAVVDAQINEVKTRINQQCNHPESPKDCMESVITLNDLFEAKNNLQEATNETYNPEVVNQASRVIGLSCALLYIAHLIEKRLRHQINNLNITEPLSVEKILKDERLMDVVKHLKYVCAGSALVQASPLIFGQPFNEQELEVTNWGTALVAVATFLVPFRGMDRNTESRHVYILQYATSIMLGTFVGANALMLPYSSLTWSEIILASAVCLAYWTSSPLSRALTLDRFVDFHPDVADYPELKRILLNLITKGRQQDLVDAICHAIADRDMDKVRALLATQNITLPPSPPSS